jgi:1-acyl-sn-glycerol-3-phosphate acyltransferase
MKTIFVYFCKLINLPLAGIFTKRTEGKKNISALKENSFILASNHINSLDIWFIGNTFKKRLGDLCFIAAMDNFKIFLQSGLLYYLADAIIINRENDKREDIIKKAIKALEGGKIMVFFPEGDTNRKKELLKGKTGMAELALETGIPVIPFGMRKAEGSCSRIIEVGKPMYFSKKKDFGGSSDSKEEYGPLLREITNKIMREISRLSHKPYST